MKRIIKNLPIVIMALTFFWACDSEKESFPPPVSETGFPEDVQRIISDNCATSGCHSDIDPQNGLDLTTYRKLFEGSKARPLNSGGTYGGEVVVPFNPEKSLLYQMINNEASVQMPFNGSPLNDEQINTLKSWIENGARDRDGNTPFPNPSYQVYVCNQDDEAISVIDGEAQVVSRVYLTDFTDATDSPHMVKVHGNYFYVTYITAGLFVKFNRETGAIEGQLGELEFPGMIQITQDGNKAFVSRSSSAPGSYNTIYSIDLNSMILLNEILLPVSGIPHGIALSSDDKMLYVANLTADRLSIIDAEQETFLDEFLIGNQEEHEPMQTTLSPDDRYLYIATRKSGKLLIFDTVEKQIVREISVGAGAMHISVTMDGSIIYLPSMMMNTVNYIEFDGTNWTKIIEITHPAFQQPHGTVLSPGEKYLYVSSRNTSGNFEPAYSVKGESNLGTVGVINTETNQVEKILEIETYGAGMDVY